MGDIYFIKMNNIKENVNEQIRVKKHEADMIATEIKELNDLITVENNKHSTIFDASAADAFNNY